jgi:hypothetical protein
LTAVEMRLTIVAGIRAPTDRTSHLDQNRPGVTLLCCSMPRAGRTVPWSGAGTEVALR